MQVSASIPEQISNKLQGNGNGIVKKPFGKWNSHQCNNTEKAQWKTCDNEKCKLVFLDLIDQRCPI